MSNLSFSCLNGPCEGNFVDAPKRARAVPLGTATAVRWMTTKGKARYAVYILVQHDARQALMYLQSYDRPHQAERKVQEMTQVAVILANAEQTDTLS